MFEASEYSDYWRRRREESTRRMRSSTMTRGELQRFYRRWLILLWKALLIRRHCPISTFLEITVAILLSLQIRLMFKPLALQARQNLDQYTKQQILSSFPVDAECWFAPRVSFVDELMERVSNTLRIEIKPADSEWSLVSSRFSNNETGKVFWAIFKVDPSDSKRPHALDYKIRSSEIGDDQMIMMNEDEPIDKDPYMKSGYIALQTAIESSFIDMWINPRLPKIGEKLIVSRFPLYNVDFLVMSSVFRPSISVIYYMMAIAFLPFPIATLQKALHDKKTGFTQLVRLMNVSYTLTYLGWLNYLMISALPATIVCTILLYPVFRNSNALLIALFVLMYIVVSTLFMLVCGMLFNRPTRALMAMLSFWLFLTHFTVVLDQYLITSKTWRVASLILPHSGLIYGVVAFTSGNELDQNAIGHLKEPATKMAALKDEPTQFWPRRLKKILMLSNNAYNVVRTKEMITIGSIIGIWCLHIVFWYLLAIYLDHINPGKFGSGESWYYVFKMRSRDEDTIDVRIRGSTNWSAVERMPSFLKPSIRMRCTTKMFGRFDNCITVLNEITIDFYQEEFNVVLGHNGSGKSTLLKLIVGMHKPTSGYVFLEGRDYSGDEFSTVSTIGYCPQENILVDYLTAIQHVHLFGMIKGMSYKEARENAVKLLEQLGLEFEQNRKPNMLSYGKQRRVCLAMALIGDTQMLILDEPTHGIDLKDRRLVWNLLSNIKRSKTILMATNSMEAADVLADKIAIISNGRIECYGSKMFLNRRFGIGYTLSLLVQENCDVSSLRDEIQNFSSEHITLRGMMGLVVRFDIPRLSRLTKLLRYLESNKVELNIVSIALNAASIEGQFLRIGLASQFNERGVQYSSDKYELIVQQRRRDLLQTGKAWTRLSNEYLWRQQILAMLYKKFLHVAATWRFYVFSISLAMFTLVLATMINELNTSTIFESAERVMNITPDTDNNAFVLCHAAENKDAMNFLFVFYATGQSYSDTVNFHLSRNISTSDLMTRPDLHSIEIRDRYTMSIDILANGGIDLMYSSTAVHSGPTAINLFHNALLRYHCGSDRCDIKLTSRPLVDPNKWQHRLVHSRSVKNWDNAAIIASFFLLLPTVDLGMKELTSLSKILQMNNIGVSTLIYWMPIYVVDVLLYALSLAFLLALLVLAYQRVTNIELLEVVQVISIFISYGACMIPFGYCVQLVTNRTERVYLAMIFMNMIAILLMDGSVILPVFFRAIGETRLYLFELFLHAIPSYVLVCALSNYVTLNLYDRKCRSLNTCATEFRIEDPCCQNCKRNGCYEPLPIMLTKQSGKHYRHSVIDDVLLMISGIFVYHLILYVFEAKNRRKWYSSNTNVEKGDEEDVNDDVDPSVVAQKALVDEHAKAYEEEKSLRSNVALVVQDLRKVYDSVPVVRGINYIIHRCECFGLLGINGVGKTTIFKMLTGQVDITAGKAILYDYEFIKDRDKFTGMLGYCPQISGLSSFMTGRQHLELHAALRGVPYKYITDEVNKWLDVLDLLDFEDSKIRNCSFGVRRKIAILQSLIGDLPMIFMDEPLSGIDPIARHAICDILHHVREMGRSLMISTHDTREAEALCLRVGILVNGQFVAIGSYEELKRKHGSDFIMNIRITPTLHPKNLTTVKRIIDEAFPGVRFKEFHLGIFKYEVDRDIPYSDVFDTMEQLRQKYSWITDFTVHQPSMDQVFLDPSKDQRPIVPKEDVFKRLYARIRTFKSANASEV